MRIRNEKNLKQFSFLRSNLLRAIRVAHYMFDESDAVKFNRLLKSEKNVLAIRASHVEIEFLPSPWNQIPYHLEKSLVAGPIR